MVSAGNPRTREPVLKFKVGLRQWILAVAKAASPAHPRSGLPGPSQRRQVQSERRSVTGLNLTFIVPGPVFPTALLIRTSKAGCLVGKSMFILAIRGNSEFAVNFGTVLEAVNADQLFCGINPIKDAVIGHAELAEPGQIFRHTDKPAMNHASGIVRESLDFALYALADGGIQPGKLSVGFASYFDLVGHGWWRGFQGLNLPATSSRRAARNSAMTRGCCAVSQS